MKALVSRIAYISILLIYASVPLVHDVIPYHTDFRMDDWLALSGMYVLGGIAALPLIMLAFRTEFSARGTSHYRVIISLFIQIIGISLLWNNSKALYIFLPVLIVTTFFFMTFGHGRQFKSPGVYNNVNSADFHGVRNGIDRKLSESEYKHSQAKNALEIPRFNIQAASNAEADSQVHTNPSSGLPMYNGVSGLDVGGNTWGNSNTDTGISVNPVSGLPMNGGMSGIDVGGNSWGTTSIDSSGNSSTYDPNRGY